MALHDKQDQPGVKMGVSFRDLSVYGHDSSTRYQPTVASYIVTLFESLTGLLSSRTRHGPQILHDFDGVVHGGEMLLVLGRPGSGCSTLLKTLAGEVRGLRIEKSGSVDYDGILYKQMHKSFKGDCIYLAELDIHFPELTLGQSLSFAAATRELGPSRALKAYNRAHDVSAQFGLDTAFNTKMGNAMIRGLSGGEKRRASIAEVYISEAQVQCWDNSTRGLDSTTALHFVQSIRCACDRKKTTILMSIYQASDSIYESFDKVTLLYEGYQIYFGSSYQAASYFIEMGFWKHPRATIADFLTSITNPRERIVREGFEDRVPRRPVEFAAAWKQSASAQALLQAAVTSKTDQQMASPAIEALHDQTLTYYIPIWAQINLCVQRGFQRLRNNYVPPVSGVIGNTIIAIVVGSVYYNLGDDTNAVDSRAVLIFFSLMINAYAPAFEVMTMWAQRPIVEKHSRYGLYHPWTESFASLICDLPNKIATCVMFNVALYFMTNLRRTASAFFTYLLFMFVTILTMSLYFRTVGSLSRTMEQTMIPCSMVIIVFSCYTGFVVPIKDMVPWLSWLRRLNPIAYAYESLMINEFSGQSYSCARIVPSGLEYQSANLEHRVCSSVGSQPGQWMLHGSDFIAAKYSFKADHLWRNLGIIVSMLLIFLVAHLVATEYIPAQQGRGEILMFRKSGKKDQQRAADEESPNAACDLDLTVSNKDNKNIADSGYLNREGQDFFYWTNVDFSVKISSETRNILTGIEGWVQPGTLTALMGVTGAGKTTLLDILANRTRVGAVSGQISLHGKERQADFQRNIGYVQQEDIHLSTATVREALEFSAQLRQPAKYTSSEKSDYVNYIIDLLDMEPYAGAIVGVAGDGLNVEQRKRLSIAVEMVARPELLLFMDEPTSGLDSQTSWSICMLLRKLADNGHSVLVTIHQPSSKLFEIFDRLLLLDKTGRMSYFGDIGQAASTLIGYFERNGAVKCGPQQNPAEWVLDATSGPVPDHGDKGSAETRRWPDVWATSPERQNVLQKLATLTQSSPALSVDATRDRQSQYAASFLRQFCLVTMRVFQDYWRNPVYVYSKMGLCVSVTLLNGLSFFNARLDIQGVTNIFFSVFLFTQLFSTIDQQVIPRLSAGRALFEARERRSKTYSWMVLLAAHIIAELFWQTVAALLIFVCWWYPTGLWRNHDASLGVSERSGLAFGMIWLFNLWISTFSQAVGVGMSHDETAVQISTLFFWLSLVFCGVLVAPDKLPKFWHFVYRASPITYFIDGTVIAGLANTKIHCSAIEFLRITPPASTSCAEYMKSYITMAGGYIANPNALADCEYCPVQDVNSILKIYGVDVRTRWHGFGYLAVYSVFNIVATFAIYWAVRGRTTKQ